MVSQTNKQVSLLFLSFGTGLANLFIAYRVALGAGLVLS